jgi:hypothetical protein
LLVRSMLLTVCLLGRRAATFAHEKLVWGLVQCCRCAPDVMRAGELAALSRLLALRGVVGTVSLPRRVHATILREAALLAKVRRARPLMLLCPRLPGCPGATAPAHLAAA